MATVAIREIQEVATSGDQSFSIPGFGTPKAAEFTVTSCLANGVFADHIQFSHGITDGVNHRVGASRSTDNIGSSSTRRVASSGSVIKIIKNNSDTIEGEAIFKEWTSSGVTITWITKPDDAYLVTCKLLTGTHLSAYVGSYRTTGFIDGSVVVSGVPFKPDMIEHFSSSISFTDSIASFMGLSIGYSTRNTVDDSPKFNGSITHQQPNGESNSQVSSLQTSGYIRYTSVGVNERSANEVTAYSNDGFTVTNRFFSSVSDIFYLALNFGSAVEFAAWAFDTPTSDGTAIDSGPAFKPQWVSYVMSRLTIGEEAKIDASAGVFGLSSFTPYEASSNAIMTDVFSSTMDTSSVSDNNPVFLPNDDKTSVVSGIFSSMQDTGPELTWFNTPASPLKWIGVAIGAIPDPVSVSTSGDLFISGPITANENVSLFIEGTGIFPVSGTMSVFVNGEVARPTVACPQLDDTASIQIGSELISIYQSRIDSLINQLGKSVLLEYTPIRVTCPNCTYDVQRQRSTGIHIPGGPRPFVRGRKCPYCKGRGSLETPVQKCIRCLIKWNPTDAEDYGISISGRKDIVRFKTYLYNFDDLVRAKHAISNYDIASASKLRVKMITEPVLVGLRESRYCISFWELL
jgi:hypothetical protein